jgi:hypothetical protein
MSSTPRRQFALQGAATFLVLSIAWPYFGWTAESMPWFESSLAIGFVAYLFAYLSRQPWWWQVMHAAFMPLIWLTQRLQIDPGWFLLAFVLLLLVYRGALSGQVPLYLSNKQTVSTLADLLIDKAPLRFLDLGAGIGSTTVPLADQFPEHHFTGVENAPLTWLCGRLLSLGRANICWRWEDLWQIKLADYDVVYAFLSPVPMPELWQKIEAEMKPGSLFISNTFPVPGLAPTQVIEVDCIPARPLFCYQR